MYVDDGYSWMMLPERHPVRAANGDVVGYAAAVLAEDNGRFDGVVVGIDRSLARDPRLLLEVEDIVALKADGIHTRLRPVEIEHLPEYRPDEVWTPSRKGKAARSIDPDGSSGWDRS